MVPGMHSHLDLQWQLPGYRRFVRGLTRHSRLIRYDKLGTGLSDPTISTPTVGERVDDLAAVAAACAATAPVLLGFSEGGPLAIRFAGAQTWHFKEFPAPDGVTSALAFLNASPRQGAGEVSGYTRNDGSAVIFYLEPGSG